MDIDKDLIKRAEDVLQALDEQSKYLKESRECKECFDGSRAYTHSQYCKKHLTSNPCTYELPETEDVVALIQDLLSAIKAKEPGTDYDQTKIIRHADTEMMCGPLYSPPGSPIFGVNPLIAISLILIVLVISYLMNAYAP